MPKKKEVIPYMETPKGIAMYEPVLPGTNPNNYPDGDDFLGEKQNPTNPIIWKRPPVGKEHGG